MQDIKMMMGLSTATAKGKWLAVEGFEMPDPPTQLYAAEFANRDFPHADAFRSAMREAPLQMLPESAMIPFGPKLFTSQVLLASQYVPNTLTSPRTLILVLHGCFQHSQSYSLATAWTQLADQLGCVLLCPQQTYPRNNYLAFNWFLVDKGGTGTFENDCIMQMLKKVKAQHGIDDARVFVTGLSAGGAMTAVMLARNPTVFAAGGILAGLPYKCANGSDEAFKCMKPGKNLTPQELGDRVRSETNHPGPWPPVSLWQGDADDVVAPMNLNELMEQWTNVHGIDQAADAEKKIKAHSYKGYQNASGTTLVETYSIKGMKHGAPVDPGQGPDQGGDPKACGWVPDMDILSSYYIARFWGLLQ